jgi:tetratricopeptide (TPR) repeat protein
MRARVHSEREEIEQAIADYSKAIELRASDDSLYSGRGFAALKKGDKAAAVEDFSKAIELKPDEGAYYTARSYVYVSQGDSAKAIDDFTRLMALKPDDKDLILRRANLYLKLNKPNEALADYEKILTKDPQNVIALAGKGEAIAKQGNRRAGAEELQKALQIASDPKEKEEIQTKLREIGVGPLQ